MRMSRRDVDRDATSSDARAARGAPERSARDPMQRESIQDVETREAVERAAAGDGQAFAALYRRHVETVHRYILFRVGDEASARDLTQDTFLRALRGIDGLELQDRFRPWLLSIARRTVQNHYRSRGRRPDQIELERLERDQSAGGWTGQQPDLQADLESGLRLEVLRAAVTRLSAAQQEVIGLRFVAGLSFDETAAATGRSLHAVRKLQYRGLALLRERLAGREEELR